MLCYCVKYNYCIIFLLKIFYIFDEILTLIYQLAYWVILTIKLYYKINYKLIIKIIL